MSKTRLSKITYDAFHRLMEARIDIKNKGTDENDLSLFEISDENHNLTKPAWFGKEGTGYSLKSIAGKIKLSATVIKDGTLNLFLHTEPFFSNDGKNTKIPVWLDYDYLFINETVVFSDTKATWHDKAYKLERPVKDGELLTIEIAWHPHLYEGKALTDILEQLHSYQMEKLFPLPSVHADLVHKALDTAKTSFSIFGICVSRDIVTKLGSRVNRFIQDISPISVCYDSPLKNEFKLTEGNIVEYLLNPKLNHFHVRNTILDMNKEVWQYLFEVKSDWLILDTGCLRYRTLINTKSNTGVTECHLHRLDYAYDKEEYDLISVLDMGNLDFERCMEQYLDKILDQYDESKIIVIETYLVNDYVDKERISICSFDKNEKKEIQNAEIRRGYDYLRQKLKKSHFIPFLDNTLGDESHKWGKASLHYVQEYYEYGSEAIKLIMGELSLANEVAQIERLKSYYERKIKLEYLY